MYLIICDDDVFQVSKLDTNLLKDCVEGYVTIIKINSDGKFIRLTPIDESDSNNYELVLERS